MSNMRLPTLYVNDAFITVCKVAQNRAEELESFESKTLVDSSEDEKEMENTLSKSFLNSIGSDGVRKMTDFTPVEFAGIFNSSKSSQSALLKNGCGKRFTYSSVNILFMTLTL